MLNDVTVYDDGHHNLINHPLLPFSSSSSFLSIFSQIFSHQVPKPYIVHVPKPVAVHKPYPVPVPVRVPKPYVVPIIKQVPVPVPKPVHKIIPVIKEKPYFVKKKIPILIEHHYKEVHKPLKHWW